MKKVCILGFGTVGGGVADLLLNNRQLYKERYGVDFSVEKILDLRDFPGSRFESKITHRFEDLLASSPDIAVECLGGTTFAYDYTKRLLSAGISVITPNKALVALHGDELMALAHERGVYYLYEASVGGGIPILRPLVNDFTANRISDICGILNGTTNYILSEMGEKGAEFDITLKEAQKLGYAEGNPASDIDGIDTCNKICILASLVSGKSVHPADIPVEGIRAITHEDILLAESKGYRIKLIGRAIFSDNTVTAYVAPHLVGKQNQLNHVSGVFNGIMVTGDAVGNVMFYGPGAGRYPTASAVVADIIDAAVHADTPPSPRWEGAADLSDGSEVECKWYIRTESACDASVFPSFNMISPSAFLTGPMTYHHLQRTLDLFSRSNKVIHALRVLD